MPFVSQFCGQKFQIGPWAGLVRPEDHGEGSALGRSPGPAEGRPLPVWLPPVWVREPPFVRASLCAMGASLELH